MLLKEMIATYPNQYIAVAQVEKDREGLIQTARVLKVYPTLQDVYKNIKELKAFMSQYKDFDVVYGDYADYVSTRKKLHYVVDADCWHVPTQFDISGILEALKKGE